MAGKRYSAGAIFLQVVPVFANVQRAIEDEAKNIDRALGDSMEKSGEKAGERAGKAASKKMQEELAKGSSGFEREFHKNIDSINAALGGIDTKKLGNDLRREVTDVKKTLASLKDVDITGEANFRRVYAEIAELEGRLRGVRDGAKIVFRSDIDDALKGFAKVAAAKEAIEDPVEIPVSADFRVAERQMTSFEKSFKKTAEKAAGHLGGSMNKEIRRIKDDLVGLQNLRIGIDISANRARAELAELQQELRQISMSDPDIDVRVDAGRAFADIATLNASLSALDAKDVDIKVKVDGERALGFMNRMGLAGDRGANAFRSFNLVLLGAVSIGPALIPVLAGIAGGLLALGPAAAVGVAGLGAVLVGFSGLGDAITALGAQQDQAAMTAQSSANSQRSSAQAIAAAEDALADARRNAARAAEDAAERVADAREAAADAIEDALERQRDAQEDYRDSVQEVRDAEQALRDARAEAAGTGADLGREIRENALAIDQALLDSFNATVEFNAVNADGSSTNAEQEQARINREEALLNLEELRAEARELAAEKKKWDEEGVNGVESVQSAQENLTSAIEAQQEALESMRDAARDADEARIDGAEAVREALEDQRESAQDSARAIADAQQAVANANRSYGESLEQVNAQQNAVNVAMEKLGPAGERFARFLFSLRKGFYRFRDDIQQVMLPAVQQAMEGFLGSNNAQVARQALINLAGAFGKFAKALSVSLRGEAWGAFFNMLANTGPKIAKSFGSAFISFMEAMASIMVAVAPYTAKLADAFADLMARFAEWAASREGQKQIADFFGMVKEVAPLVIDFIVAFVEGIAALVVALAPLGEAVLEKLTQFFEFIANMDKDVLGVVATAVVLVLTLSQIIFGVASLVAGVGSLLTPVGAIIIGIVLLVAAFVYLWETNEGFRDFVIEAWDRISAAFKKAWEDSIKPALMELWDAVSELWDEVLAPFFAWLAPIVLWIAERIIPLLGRWFGMQIRLIAWYIRNVAIPVLRAIGSFFKWLWFNVAKPVWEAMAEAWEDLANGFNWVWKRIIRPTWDAISTAARWLWKNVLRPTFEAIETGWDGLMRGMRWAWNNVLEPIFNFITEDALPGLERAFDVVVGAIQTIWNGLRRVIAAPIRFVLETIINDGLIDGFNRVAGWVGHDGFNHIPIPNFLQNYATGGVMPGYTPGRDVHEFVSPTGGRLHLSGGEAVMRPEFTAAVGDDWVNSVNAAAMGGGVGGVRKMLGYAQGFASGGKIVFPVPGGYVERTAYNLGHDGMDINHANDASGKVPYLSATSGRVTTTGYSRGYGNAVFVSSPYGELVYGHSYDGTVRVAPGQTVSPGQWLANIGNTGNSSGAHLHFGFPGGTFGMAENLLSGAAHIKFNKKIADRPAIPDWLMSIVKDPLGAVKGWITKPISAAADYLKESPIFGMITKTPALMAKKATDKVWDIVPGWVKTAAGWAGDAAGWAVGGVKNAGEAALDAAGNVVGGVADGAGAVGDFLGLSTGGILPYNGTMKYDAGGYLPPGITNVVNMTGKPEPVFTADQYESMDGGPGGTIHYEPHFEGTNLTAADVASDLNFTFRRIRRGGKYEGAGK